MDVLSKQEEACQSMENRRQMVKRGQYFITVSPHYVHSWCDRPKVLVRLFVTYVARADDLLDLAYSPPKKQPINTPGEMSESERESLPGT